MYTDTMKSITFFVQGNPIPKQSFRYTKNGGGFTDPRMKTWQEMVAAEAHNAMVERDMLTGNLKATLMFSVNDKRRKDLDNLSKGTLDALTGIVFKDDSQIIRLTIEKQYDKSNPGVFISVQEAQNGLGNGENASETRQQRVLRRCCGLYRPSQPRAILAGQSQATNDNGLG
jgi:Holliday junction resolvase RusA-like endonuclease